MSHRELIRILQQKLKEQTDANAELRRIIGNLQQTNDEMHQTIENLQQTIDGLNQTIKKIDRNAWEKFKEQFQAPVHRRVWQAIPQKPSGTIRQKA